MFLSNSTDPHPLFIRFATRTLEFCGAALLFSMMALTFVDVVARYIFSSPVPGGFEITEIMLATLIFCGLPLITLRDGHITVDLLENVLPDAFRSLRDRVVFIGAGIMLLYLFTRLWVKAGDMFDYSDQTAVLNLPLAPVCYIMCVLVAISGVLSVALGIFGDRSVVTGRGD